MSSLPSGITPLKVTGVTGSQLYEGWKLSKFRFENYLLAAEVGTDIKEDRKVAMLLHALRSEVVPIYQSFNSKRETAKLEDIITLFE